ncbi:S41 family peptidase [Telluria beijingensis]|uniref:S41 family peptidase n=1 Tax=Telluria beijingensis TaxID=3068633 RepID=UPI0027953D44|nr:S41 family peptidase [Massilia sp. REN29]
MKTTSTIKPARMRLAVGFCSLYAAAASAAAPPHPWAAMAQSDADFVTHWLERQSITAVYPDQQAFAAQLTAARRVFDAESARVSNYAGYRHALLRFVGSLQDVHLRLNFTLLPATWQWPGFQLVYRGGRYLAVSSQGSAHAGQEVTHCDGKPLADWVNQAATYEQIVPGLESSGNWAAPLVLRDGGSPFIPRPRSCTIGGRDVVLDWQPVAASRFAADRSAATVFRDRVAAATPFGADGAWVRMGFFAPQTQAEGKAFRQLIAEAPALRDKSVLVIDVRGNGGGSYEWFMGFLRALYGKDYADAHARSRLGIAHVMRTTPEILAYFKSDSAAEVDALAPPADGTPFDPDYAKYQHALESGQTVFVSPKNARAVPLPKGSPVNPVKARVLLLTDYNCGSACIVFVDEMKRFPGVEQIGVETGIDSRTGTSFPAPLPSGNGMIEVPVVTRDGRERGDNIPHRPHRLFTGNITDTAAVQAWIRDEILGSTSPPHASP